MTPVGRDDSARRASQDFALRGEFLSQRWERNQRIARGGLRWASPPIVAPPPDPRNLRGPNSRGRPVTVRRGRDHDCPRNRAAAAIGPNQRRPGRLDRKGAPDGSRSNFCGDESAGGSGDPPLQGNFGHGRYDGRRCIAALYERALNRRRGGPMWPPACPLPENVSPTVP